MVVLIWWMWLGAEAVAALLPLRPPPAGQKILFAFLWEIAMCA